MKKRIVLCLLIIFIIATFFRLWRLDSIPPGLYPDEAINGNEAITSSGKLFYPENNGREGLFINLIALSFSIFGISICSLRLVSAIIGILTVPGLYFLTKEVFFQSPDSKEERKTIALLSSFFLAISFWHINFSRIAFRGILVPFTLVFAFYFLFRGLRTKKTFSFIISGIIFGLGFYSYISYRFVVLLLPIALVIFRYAYKKESSKKQFLFSIFYFLFSIFIVALPIGIYFLKNPQDFIGRATPISIFATENPLKEFGKSLLLHLAMFNFYGDSNWRHNFSSLPQLFWLVGILFLIGFFLSVKNLFLAKKEKNYFLFSIFCFLVSWLFIFLLPGILTHEGIPHSLRTIGVIPIIYIFAAFGGYNLYCWLKNKFQNKKLLLAFCFLFFFLLTFAQFYKYFFCWAKKPEVTGSFTEEYVKIGNYLNSLPSVVKKYIIVNRPGVPVPWPEGIPMAAQTPIFIERIKSTRLTSTYLLPEDLGKIKIDNKKTIIVLMGHEEGLLKKLAEIFPQGKVKEQDTIWSFQINPQ